MKKSSWEAFFKTTSYHRKEIEAGEFITCYYCFGLSSVKSIKEWCDRGQTAICPKCGIDAVVPYDDMNHEDQSKQLKEAHEIGFGNGKTEKD